MIDWDDGGERIDTRVGSQVIAVASYSIYYAPDSEGLRLDRLVPGRGKFGLHNASIAAGCNGELIVTSLYD